MSELSEFRSFCHQASDAQLPEIFKKERAGHRYATAVIALSVAASRGIVIEETEENEGMTDAQDRTEGDIA